MKNALFIGNTIAIGKIQYITKQKVHIPAGRHFIPDKELERLNQAKRALTAKLEKIREAALSVLSPDEAAIFDMHIMLLNDEVVFQELCDFIKAKHCSAEFAVEHIKIKYIETFSKLADDYFVQRALDIRDVADQMIQCLNDKQNSYSFQEDAILLFDEITASEASSLTDPHIKGVISRKGSLTSHASIILQSLNLPTVFADVKAADGITAIVDPIGKQLIIEPEANETAEYQRINQLMILKRQTLEKYADRPTKTADNYPIELAINISSPLEAKNNYHVGVGLFRTEFLYLKKNQEPSESSQIINYCLALSANPDKTTVIRTMDIGGDKQLSYLDVAKENNPFLGLRAIRLSLAKEQLFRTQLRALLKASTQGKLAIMFPMITTLEELRSAKKMLAEEKNALLNEGVEVAEKIEVGIMIETPAASLIADKLAKEVDFFSIGTNDLIQYTLAVDRTNETVAELYQAFHPAVLKLIAMSAEAAAKQGIWCGVCGEMANDRIGAALLIGLGVNELSLTVHNVLSMRHFISLLRKEKLSELAAKALECDNAGKVSELIKNELDLLV